MSTVKLKCVLFSKNNQINNQSLNESVEFIDMVFRLREATSEPSGNVKEARLSASYCF